MTQMSRTATPAKVRGRVRRDAESSRRARRRAVLEYLRTIVFAVAVALFIRQFIIQAVRIPSGSMKDTLLKGDFLFVNKFLYGAEIPDRIRPLLFTGPYIDLPWENVRLPAIRQPRQGYIIVFEYPVDIDKDYIKRCVAVAGDTVEVRQGLLYVNGAMYEENFADRDGDHACYAGAVHDHTCLRPHTRRETAKARAGRNWSFGPLVVPDDNIFMMGDNRYNSEDSRYWGPLALKHLKGSAMFIYWSWDPVRNWPRWSRIGDIIR